MHKAYGLGHGNLKLLWTVVRSLHSHTVLGIVNGCQRVQFMCQILHDKADLTQQNVSVCVVAKGHFTGLRSQSHNICSRPGDATQVQCNCAASLRLQGRKKVCPRETASGEIFRLFDLYSKV